jgi:hypothetical protein
VEVFAAVAREVAEVMHLPQAGATINGVPSAEFRR